MANDKDGMTGRDLRDSQAGGESGDLRGYGSSQNVVNQQDQRRAGAQGQSRGERDDEAANGGRGPESISPDDDEIARDQQAHQDRGQSDIEFEREQS